MKLAEACRGTPGETGRLNREDDTLMWRPNLRRRVLSGIRSWKMTADRSSPAGHLLVVMSNPPTTSGARTLQRVEVAKVVLGYSTVAAVNLFSIPTYRTSGISEVGKSLSGWLEARIPLTIVVDKADAVVLAYGCQEPSGAARLHFRNQLDWLHSAIDASQLPVWMIDGRPRHPSRWHRHTFAQHPELAFAEALPLVLRPTLGRSRHQLTDSH